MEENRKKQLLAALAGLVDPWLRQKAQEVAGTVSENSVLRNKSVEAVLGSLKGFIETWAEKLPPAAATAIEKATDFSDFFAGALGSNTPFAKNWLREFVADAFRRLREAKDPQAEFEKIKKEFELRQQLLELIRQAREEEISKYGLGQTDWATTWSKFANRIRETEQGAAQKIQEWRSRQT